MYIMGLQSKYEIHLCFIYTVPYTNSLKIILYSIFSALEFILRLISLGQMWNFPLVVLWWYAKSFGFQNISNFVFLVKVSQPSILPVTLFWCPSTLSTSHKLVLDIPPGLQQPSSQRFMDISGLFIKILTQFNSTLPLTVCNSDYQTQIYLYFKKSSIVKEGS